MQDALPEADVELRGQSVHRLELVAAVDVEYLPITQAVHGASPSEGLKLPAAQATQAPPPFPENPALHRQSGPPSAEPCALASSQQTLLPSGAFVPVGQAAHVLDVFAPVAAEYVLLVHRLQASLPGTLLNFPARHGAQVTLPDEVSSGVYPALQRQSEPPSDPCALASAQHTALPSDA